MKKLNSILLILTVAFSTSCATLNKASKTYTQQVLELSTDSTKFNAIVGVKSVDGSCTGTVVSPTKVLTAAHCITNYVNEYKVVSIVNSEKKFLVVDAKLIMVNKDEDIAILGGDFSEFNSIKIDPNPENDLAVNPNFNAVNCGFAYGGRFVCYKMNQVGKLGPLISAVGQMYQGMSGGPVIDLNSGHILGINLGYMTQQPQILVTPLTNLGVRLQKVED